MTKPNIGIPEKQLEAVVDLLSVVLADKVVLYTKTRKFHWNVGGENFMQLHKLFQDQYTQLEESIDLVAERISKLGSKAIGTMYEFGKLSSLKEHPGKNPDAKDMIQELLDDHELIIQELRKSIEKCAVKHNDAGSADFLTAQIEQHETIAWTLRRYMN